MPFERIVEITPAFDKRHSDPTKNFGIHGAEMRFLLKGELGVVQFLIYTNWHLPHVEEELRAKQQDSYNLFAPMGADVGYHSPRPLYEGQEPISKICEYLGGKPCYYDGSGLAAEDLLNVLISQGGEAMWTVLEERYERWFVL